jgi:hypothetical protein
VEHYQKMSIFDYTLPSGENFTVRGPAGATQIQADEIFYQQVVAGSLVGYTAGQTLTGTTTQITKFELSRLDRGTAAVDTVAVLAVIQGLPVVSGIPDLINVPLENPVTQADIVATQGATLGAESVGILNEYQVQLLLSQISNLVKQPSNAISQEKGIGAYGFNCFQLEQAGYVKPGTADRFLSDPTNFVSVMQSNGIWTGLNGVESLDRLLSNIDIQNRIQVTLMQQSYESLNATGAIKQYASPSATAVTGQIYTQQGFQNISALTLLAGGALPRNLLNNLTVNSIANIGTLGSGAVNRFLTGGIGVASNQVATQITNSVGSLVTNASKFGTQAASNWIAGNSNLLGTLPALNINTLSTGITSLTNVNFNSIQKYATNLVPPNINQLTSSLNVYGKAAQFSLGLSNPLAGITNAQNLATGALTNAQNLATGALTNAQNLATGALTNAQNLATGALTNAQNLATGALTNAQAQAQALVGNLKNLTNFSSAFSGGGDLVSGTQLAAGFSNTVNRSTVNAAVARIVGNDKIPLPQFEFPSPEVLASNLNIKQAQNILNNIRGTGSAVRNLAQTAVGRANSLINNTRTQIAGAPGVIQGQLNRVL